MCRVLRIDEQLRRLEMPRLLPAHDFHDFDWGGVVLCAGFEERAVSVLDAIPLDRDRGLRVVVVEYEPYVQGNRSEEVRHRLQRAGLEVSFVAFDRESPDGAGREIVELLKDIDGRVCLDISSMSRLLIVQVMVALFEDPELVCRSVVRYAEASVYPPSEQEVRTYLKESAAERVGVESILVSSFVYNVAVVPELSSMALQGEPIRCILFPSFNTYQLDAMLSEVQPAKVSVVNGVPPAKKNGWRKQAIRELNRMDGRSFDEHDASTLDYRDTLRILLDLYGRFGDCQKLIVAPTGSKLQAVAVGIMRAFLRDVQIAYPAPLRYAPPERVTVGVGDSFLLDLAEFGSFRDLHVE